MPASNKTTICNENQVKQTLGITEIPPNKLRLCSQIAGACGRPCSCAVNRKNNAQGRANRSSNISRPTRVQLFKNLITVVIVPLLPFHLHSRPCHGFFDPTRTGRGRRFIAACCSNPERFREVYSGPGKPLSTWKIVGKLRYFNAT